MAVSKVIYGGKSIIDLTSDTVTKETLFAGYKAHDKAGNIITGTAAQVNITVSDSSVMTVSGETLIITT